MDKNENPYDGILRHEEGVDLVPSNLELSSMEMSLVTAMCREMVMKNYLSEIKDKYDYAKTGNTIPYAGAGFQIYDPNGNLVSMTFTYPEVTTIDTFSKHHAPYPQTYFLHTVSQCRHESQGVAVYHGIRQHHDDFELLRPYNLRFCKG